LENFTALHFIIEALIGAVGMLIGGFIVYHKIEWMMLDLQKEVKRVHDEQKEEMEIVWEKFDLMQPREICLSEKKGCMLQFAFFKEGQGEIKDLFKDLRTDLKAELKLLRECISAATEGKC
jgi:hypothetical protein